MKPERTFRYLATAFTKIYPYRDSILNHLFLIDGNGFRWYAGELIEDLDGGDYEAPDKNLPDIVKWDGFSDEEWLRLTGDPFRNRNHRFFGNWERYSEFFPPKGQRIWNIGERFWEKFERIPKDITPEWQRVVDELVEKLLEDGFDVKNRKFLEGHERHMSSYWEAKAIKGRETYWKERENHES